MFCPLLSPLNLAKDTFTFSCTCMSTFRKICTSFVDSPQRRPFDFQVALILGDTVTLNIEHEVFVIIKAKFCAIIDNSLV